MPETRRKEEMAVPVKTANWPFEVLNSHTPSSGAVHRCQAEAAFSPSHSPGSMVAP